MSLATTQPSHMKSLGTRLTILLEVMEEALVSVEDMRTAWALQEATQVAPALAEGMEVQPRLAGNQARHQPNKAVTAVGSNGSFSGTFHWKSKTILKMTALCRHSAQRKI